MSFIEKFQEVEAGNKLLFKAAPELMAAFNKVVTAASGDGALGAKTKELMALAIAVATRCEGCIVYHGRAAFRHGASRAEIVEALGVAVELGGGSSVVYAGMALKAFDEFSAG